MSKNMADEQVIVWLKSMCQDSNLFNSINAENALNLIAKLKKQNRSLGAHFCNLKKQRNRVAETLATFLIDPFPTLEKAGAKVKKF